ncbi:MAG: LiaF transmembrane domain-containing protein, partial [Flavisolibacter sp.]
MNEERFKKEVEERWGGHRRNRTHRVWTGLLLFIIGGLLLLKIVNPFLFPYWFFTWPVLMIGIGLFSGIRHGFRGPFWLIMITLGSIFLAGQLNPTMHLERFIWPIMLMVLGVSFILRPKRRRWARCGYGPYGPKYKGDEIAGTVANPNATNQSSNSTAWQDEADRGDFVDVTSVFGGVKKN